MLSKDLNFHLPMSSSLFFFEFLELLIVLAIENGEELCIWVFSFFPTQNKSPFSRDSNDIKNSEKLKLLA